MNSRHAIQDPVVEEQAALWAARLEGAALSAPDREALDVWLAASPVHRALLSEYCQFSSDLEGHLPVMIARGTVRMPVVEKPRRRFFGFALSAGMALAAAAIAMVFWLGRPATQRDNVATAVAERQVMVLTDGTRVELNARTTARIELTRTERRVHLAEGQAFFTVTKDPARPFVVETPAGSVRVTGTAFDVRAGTGPELHVTVAEGSVLVRPGEVGTAAASSPVVLRARDQFSAVNGIVSRRVVDAEQLDDLLAWRQGVVVFEAVPLGAVLARFAHHHGRGINVHPEAAGHRVTGRYSLDDLAGFIGGLDQAFPVQVTYTASGTISVTPRPGHN